ncbi:MAG: hypothetical protein ABIN55_10120 [Aeromicrobium sp.]
MLTSDRLAVLGDDTYLHAAVDGFSRVAYTEALDDQKAITAIGFLSRSRAFFPAHGIIPISPGS